jgi:P27 family predicted phage terminase small subunit
VAKKEWKRVAPELEKLGLLTRVDMAALAGYCQGYARWVQAEKALADYGLTFVTDTGYITQRPEVAIGNKALDQVRAFCVQFGLTPSSRARMTLPEVDDAEEDNPFDV